MENKYYIPKIEELYVGYELECNVEGNWIKVPYQLNFLQGQGKPDLKDTYRSLSEGHIRTPFLTAEQIEAEGWIPQPSNQAGKYFRKGDIFISFYRLRIDETSDGLQHKLLIYRIHDPEVESSEQSTVPTEMLYNGSYKSINEFRTILRFLEI